jgi:aryl-alcohol dehydrogenase-like predicted oxidoreductase
MTKERVANFPESDWRTREDEFQEPRLSRNLKWADKLAEIGKRHGRSAGQAAVAWTLHHPAVTGAIVGARSAAQVDGIIGAMDFRLSEDEYQEIEQFVK